MRELLEFFGVLETTPRRARRRQSRGPQPLQLTHTPRREARPAVPNLGSYNTAKDRAAKHASKGWRMVPTVNGPVESRGQEARTLERTHGQYMRGQAA